MEEGILRVIAAKMTAERFDKVASEEREYLKKNKLLEELSEQLKGYGLTKDQSLAVDRLLTANNECNFRYSELAYIQGMKDSVAMLKELDLIKAV